MGGQLPVLTGGYQAPLSPASSACLKWHLSPQNLRWGSWEGADIRYSTLTPARGLGLIVPILRKQRLREVEGLAQSHTAIKVTASP